MRHKNLAKPFIALLLIFGVLSITGGILEINWLFKTGVSLIGILFMVVAVLIGAFQHTELINGIEKPVAFAKLPSHEVHLIRWLCFGLGLIGLLFVCIAFTITI